ncbi:hypothetical protein FB451DRAFT_1016013 [Mycena latifolia]|nr:hypothetical protein FB451DRAFT_1016013 [Mycena latifolia]
MGAGAGAQTTPCAVNIHQAPSNNTQGPAMIGPVGNVAAVQSTTGDTRLYYQDASNAIRAAVVTGTFTVGRLTSDVLVVPAAQALSGTPIAATAPGDFHEVILSFFHLFFVSRTFILSEYIWRSGTGWAGGPSCSDCVDAYRVAVQGGSRILYAMMNQTAAAGTPAVVRVGFMSATGLLSEATYVGGRWSVGPLHD